MPAGALQPASPSSVPSPRRLVLVPGTLFSPPGRSVTRELRCAMGAALRPIAFQWASPIGRRGELIGFLDEEEPPPQPCG